MNLRAIQSCLSFRRAKDKCFAIVLVVVTLVVVVSCSVFDEANSTSVTMCNSNSYELHIVDASVTQQPEIPSVEAVNDPGFRAFITSVTGHVLSKFAGAMPCQENSDGEPMLNLVFVRLPLVTSRGEPISPMPSLNALHSDATRRLDSPWLKLTIGRSTSPQIHAVFIWNERQFLLDQAIMSGVRASSTTPLVSIDDRIFTQFVQNYTDSVLLAASPEAQSAAQSSMSERLPADILWLFRHARQSTRGPFSGEIDNALRSIIQRAAIGYSNLTKVLVDQFFASSTTEIRYESVLDLENVFTVDQYRINQLH